MIVKMKFLSITGPKADIDRVVEQYLSKYEIHLENALSELTTVQNLTPYFEINPYRETLNMAAEFYSMLDKPEKLESRDMTLEEALDLVNTLDEKIAELNRTRTDLEEEKASVAESMKIIQPFRELDYNISSILDFKYVRYRFGRIERSYYEKFERYIYNSLDTVFYKCHEDDEYIWGVYFAPHRQVHKIDAVYSSMHFERIYVPDDYDGTPEEAYGRLKEHYNGLAGQIQQNRDDLEKLLEDNSVNILSAKEKIETLSSEFDVRKVAACTRGDKDVFYILCGWMSEEDTVEFQKEISEDENLFCIIEDKDHNIYKQPPTKLKNPKLFKPFEMYVKMYGLPAYNEMDPTWFVAVTYAFIFGAMFGDAGQGLCLLIGGFLLYKFKRIDLAGIISAAGVFSTFFGFMFGSFFGFEDLLPAIWLRPVDSMTTLPFIGKLNTVFVVAIAFGMFIILVCMVFHIINGIRAKDPENSWFDTNALAGLVFYGMAVTVIALFMTGNALPGTAILCIGFILPLLVIFFKEPLTNLVEKKAEIMPKEKGMFVVQGIFEMFEVILSYFSNTLSFVRIGAFAVSHAAMMEVVLMLAGAESGSPNWIVVVLGNVFVVGMEGLIVGIQVLRLEYYEIFSRFYKGTGRAFKPFLYKKSNKS